MAGRDSYWVPAFVVLVLIRRLLALLAHGGREGYRALL